MNLEWYKQKYPTEYREAETEFNEWAETHGIDPYEDEDTRKEDTIFVIQLTAPVKGEITKDNLEEISKDYEVMPILLAGDSTDNPRCWVRGKKKTEAEKYYEYLATRPFKVLEKDTGLNEN